MCRNPYFLWLFMLIISCNDNIVFSDYQATKNGYWQKDGTIKFNFSELDTVSTYNMFINIRNDETFPYRNLFLIAELDFPNGETVKDTLEYEMAMPNGKWIGKGFGNVKENKLWYKENIVFTSPGAYTLKISHAMRRNGEVEGLQNLMGITDVGFQIAKSK